MKSDQNTTIQELRDILRKFRDDRDWQQFHDPKNLSIAISIEAAELQELFLWQTKDHVINKVKTDIEFREKVGDELADIMIFCLNFANSTNLDISAVIERKIEKGEKRYPVDKSKGIATKYNQL